MMFTLLIGCGAPKPICEEGATPWSPGTPAFTEATEDWGLEGVAGVRLAAVDFDGDGWIDLHVHSGSETGDDFGPDGTRTSWLLRNDEGRGFVDVTQSSGFRGDAAMGRPGSIVAFGDVDNDGDLDGFTAVVDADGTIDANHALMLNRGDGTFEMGPSGPWNAERNAPAGASFVDFDKDGDLDLWVPRNSAPEPQQDQLFANDGTGMFTLVTQDVGLQTTSWDDADALDGGRAHTNAWSANACDVDGNGWPDLLAASYGRAPNHLWLNQDGSFENHSVDSGYAFDDNLDYTDNQFFLCYCASTSGDPDCTGVDAPLVSCSSINWSESRDKRPYRNGGNSAATSCRDIDNDGDLDLLTGEIQHWWAGEGSDAATLLINDGSGTFDRPGSEALGLTRDLPESTWDKGDMTNTTLDFDNDGWADVFIGSSDYTGTRALLWHQDSPLSFTEVKPVDFFHHKRSHGVVTADFDRDGDLDVVVGHSRARCDGECYATSQVRLFENTLGGNFVQLDLVGADGSNRSAVGARVEVTTDATTQTLEVGTSYGHYGAQNPHRIHVGLGDQCRAKVKVTWPDLDSTTQDFKVTAGHLFQVEQGTRPKAID